LKPQGWTWFLRNRSPRVGSLERVRLEWAKAAEAGAKITFSAIPHIDHG
jgi:hypothetical protein